MKTDTIKSEIKSYLSNGEWKFAGTIGADVGAKLKHKSSIVERRLREVSSGKGSDGKSCEAFLEKRYVPNPSGKGSPVVQYRLKIVQPVASRVVKWGLSGQGQLAF